ncbi:hypothetical protein Q5H93_14835 [Hymenobacter sp. ASUV-10]|uniref:Uncharacterized protein n=1 Tax=Hymenobacter aranciens TaxID=3063996 RepID=A0ABT9BCT7_9BACT|nr:hypothetical protein [Hymenobacter sp. ASUV-10]MDO7876017.1 hypothetical protein [Hymenobacter sp. ASUV-10]
MVATHHLVEIVKASTPARPEHPILFTLDAGIGNSINYYYLGQAWGAVLLAKGGAPPC